MDNNNLGVAKQTEAAERHSYDNDDSSNNFPGGLKISARHSHAHHQLGSNTFLKNKKSFGLSNTSHLPLNLPNENQRGDLSSASQFPHKNLQNPKNSKPQGISKVILNPLNKSEQMFESSKTNLHQVNNKNPKARKAMSLPNTKAHWAVLRNAFKCVVLLKNPQIERLSNEENLNSDINSYFRTKPLNLQKIKSVGGPSSSHNLAKSELVRKSLMFDEKNDGDFERAQFLKLLRIARRETQIESLFELVKDGSPESITEMNRIITSDISL